MNHQFTPTMRTSPLSDNIILPFARTAGAFLGPRGCLFTFHRAAPSEIWKTLPNREFYLDLEFLDRLLTYLTRSGWEIVTMDEAIRRSASAGGNDRYINFSVDDGYRDTFEEVVPVFRRHRLPVTVFVTTGIPDGTLPLWAAGLELALLQKSQVILEGKTIDVDSAESKQAAFRAIAASWECADTDGCYRRFCELNGVDAEELHRNYAISWEMLEILREDPLVEIGAHTVSHARIAALSVADAVAEVRGSRERLSKRLDIDVRHFAFPFGRSGDCGPRDFEIARQSGFASAATTRKGLVRQNQNPFSLPRNTINGAHRSLALMESHLTGLSGFAARMIGRV